MAEYPASVWFPRFSRIDSIEPRINTDEHGFRPGKRFVSVLSSGAHFGHQGTQKTDIPERGIYSAS
jgi:hypothetical protein